MGNEKHKTIKVMGLDCSSSTIGWGLLGIKNNKIKYLDSGFIKPPKNGSIVDRIITTRDMVAELIMKCSPDHIGIEDIIQFMSKQSSANTIITFATFNRMVCLVAADILREPPALYNVMSIRHGLKFDKTLPKKEDMPELIAKHLKFSFPYELNTRGNNKVENNDVADGLAVALYHSFILTGKIVPKIKKGD